MDISLILTVISVVLLVPSFFGHFRGVGGGATLGLVVGIIVGVNNAGLLKRPEVGLCYGLIYRIRVRDFGDVQRLSEAQGEVVPAKRIGRKHK